MTLLTKPICGALLVLSALLLGGCVPSAQSQLDEEKEPHFLAGKSRLSALDYSGAVESFEKALEVNPHSSAAHFELGCLFGQQQPDPAAAIYHYEQYRRLRPGADNAELVNQRIMICKQVLAGDVSLGPVNGKVQRELEQLAEDKKKLTQENKRLQDELDQVRAYANRLACLTNTVVSPSNARRGSVAGGQGSETPPSGPESVARSAGSAATPRTHAVKAGETPTLIAKKYGIKLETLMAANPKVDAHRLRIGQTIAIPSPYLIVKPLNAPRDSRSNSSSSPVRMGRQRKRRSNNSRF